jgi:perosamine synthetase
MSWFVYVVRLDDGFDRATRDRIVERMRDSGIACGRYFAPIHLQPYYSNRFGFEAGAFPICEAAADRAIALPFFNRITDAELDEVCDTLGSLIATSQSRVR